MTGKWRNPIILLGLISVSSGFAIYGFLMPSRMTFGSWRMYSGLAMNVCLIEFYDSSMTKLDRFEIQGASGREDLLSKEVVLSSENDAQAQVDKVCENQNRQLYVSFWCRDSATWKPLWMQRPICHGE